MKILLGPFHPHLEDALATEVRAERSRELLSPLLIVVPSDALRRRVKTLLAREHGLHLLNLSIHSFFQLSLRLFEEAHSPQRPALCDDTFMEEALRRVVTSQPVPPSFAGMMENDGTCATLWQSVRDMKHGLVGPDVALEALDEGHFTSSDDHGLRELFSLYQTVMERFPEWGAEDHGDLDVAAERTVADSRFLAGYRRIYYYGFYDLTQSQLDLFRSVARSHPVSLFFPLVAGHPGWSFAQGFFERHLQGLAGPDEVKDLTADHPRGQGAGAGVFANDHAVQPDRLPDCSIVSCSGTRDEVLFSAKTILSLVEDEGLDFGRYRDRGTDPRCLRALDRRDISRTRHPVQHHCPRAAPVVQPGQGHPVAGGPSAPGLPAVAGDRPAQLSILQVP